MKYIRNQMMVMCIILLVSSSFVSCADSTQTSLPVITYDRMQMPFRITWTDYSGRGVAIKKIVDLYNQKSSSPYEIVVQSGDEDNNAIGAFLSEEDVQQIFVLPYRYVEYFGNEGVLMDLSDSFQKDKDLFYPEIWKLGTVKGHLNGIPWLGHSICLIYNKQLLKEADVSPESIKSLPALVKALEAVESKTEAKGIGLVGANHNDISWMVNQFIYGFGAGLVDENGGKVIINNEKAKAAIDFYKNTLGTHAQPSWLTDTGVDVMDHFRKQEIAFEFQGIWGVTDIEKNGNPFEVGVINLEDIGLYAEVGPMMLSIPRNMDAKKQKEAISFIEFMISEEAQEKIIDGEYSPEHDAYYPFRVPVRMDLVDSLVIQKNPQYLPFIKGFKRPSIDVPVPKWQIIKDTLYAPGLNQVMKSEITTDEFLKMIETKGNEILNED